MTNCDNCPLKGRPKVPPVGDIKTAKYILVGEAPGREEAQRGEPFVGQSGRLLNQVMRRVGIDRSDCYLTNVAKCWPVNNDLPPAAAKACQTDTLRELAQAPRGTPMAVMGKTARDCLWPAMARQGLLSTRGWRKAGERDVLIMPHPAYFLYNQANMPMLMKDMRRLALGGPRERVKAEYQLLENETAVEAMLEYFTRRDPPGGDPPVLLSFDLETVQIDFQRDRILALGIGMGGGRSYIIPDYVLYQDGERFVTTDWDEDDWRWYFEDTPSYPGTPNDLAVRLLQKLWGLQGYRWTGHNAKFDLRFLKGQLGVANARVDYDTIVMHYTLDERGGGHGLKGLADDYYDVGDYEREIKRYLSKKSDRYSNIPRKVLYGYLAMDVELTHRLCVDFRVELEEAGMWERPFLFPMMHALPMLLDMEMQGICIDWGQLRKFDEEDLGPELESVRNILRGISGKPDLNPRSAPQMNAVLYDEMHLPIVEIRTRAKGKKVKKRSSAKEVVDTWLIMKERGQLEFTEEQESFIKMTKYYRHVAKMRSSYVRKWEAFHGTDDRVHPTFLLRGTVTGRLAAKDPPVQTIPSDPDDSWGQAIATSHVAAPGRVFLYADFSQFELRIAAVLSGDRFMLSSFNQENPDYHTDVARAAYGEGFTKFQRDFCKRLTFGWLYGGNAYAIARDGLQFSEEVARRFANNWNARFKEMGAWRNAQGRLMLKQGYVESVFGRRRRYPLITSSNRGEAQRQAMNMPIQSGASDINLIAAVELHDRWWRVLGGLGRVALLIHDSLVMEVLNEETVIVGASMDMQKTMERIASEAFPGVPFVAEVKVGRRLEQFMEVDEWLSQEVNPSS